MYYRRVFESVGLYPSKTSGEGRKRRRTEGPINDRSVDDLPPLNRDVDSDDGSGRHLSDETGVREPRGVQPSGWCTVLHDRNEVRSSAKLSAVQDLFTPYFTRKRSRV